ncbi:MAG: PilN domain-containing protein [Candidatus Magasanikbacteria bacterium]|nr:PilN domain-containing protein [Candidatus Magasanikbacteria bacterium]
MVRFQFVKNILEIILIVTCVIGIAMLGGEWVLENYFSDLNATIASLQSRYADTNRTVKLINEKLGQIEFVQSKYRQITPLLPKITEAMPNAINLTALNVNMKNKTMQITGFAPSRDDLLEFQTRLEAVKWVEKVNIPVDQLTKKDNISFSFSTTLKEL